MDPPRASCEKAALDGGLRCAGTALEVAEEWGALEASGEHVANAVTVDAGVQLAGEAGKREFFIDTGVTAADVAATVRADSCAAAAVAGGVCEAPELTRKETGGERAAGGQSWMLSEQGREKIWRMMGELQEVWRQRGRVVRVDDVPELADDAETFKNALLYLRPRSRRDWDVVLMKNPAFWNRISLHHLRMLGKRHWFALVHSLDDVHRLLVIKIPPRVFVSEEAKLEHAWRQATYRDDERGRFAPGLRVADDFMELLEPEDRATLGKDYLSGGHWLDFVETPKTCFKPNYISYEEQGERAAADLQRQVQAGWLEGPLHYRPRVVHAQAGIYAPEKDKFRPVVDARRSGLNDAIRPGECSYDMLDDLLEVLGKDDRHGSFDLVDAFYMWPTENRFCDYQGLQGPRCSPGLYRNRDLGMGVRSSPGIQQRWARAIKKVVNREVLHPLSWRQMRGGLEDGGRGAAAIEMGVAALPGGLEVEKAELAALRARGVPSDDEMFTRLAELAVMYVDDGQSRHPACFSARQADEQFAAMLRFFDMYGLEYSAKKNVWPSERGEYLGVALDTTVCEASVTPERAVRYVRAIEALLEEQRGRGDVGRRALASVTGKLIFASAVAPELRSMLAPCYWAQQAFVEAPGGGAEWAPWVRVRLDGAAVSALEAAAVLLADHRRLRRRWYPHADPELAGFWRGRVRDTHADMDATHRTSDGVVVVTGDASGDQGAAVTVVREDEGERRAVWEYAEGDSAPAQSSNWRELDTVVRPLEMWGAELAGQRVLVRTDNTTARAVVNRRGTNSANLLPLSERLAAVCRRHDLDVAAVHIPGEQNALADALSRMRRGWDQGDWMLARAAFERVQQVVQAEYGVRFTLDGSADPLGSNRQLPRFCSAVNSVLQQRLVGEQLYCNPDFELIEEVLRHFLVEYRRADVATSGTFVLPCWMDRSWWRLLRGAKVVAYWPAGSALFTSPDWRGLEAGGGRYRWEGSRPRVFRGPTRWPVLVAHYPPLLAHRGRPQGTGLGGARGGLAARAGLPTLRGEAATDMRLLSGLPPCAVP